MSRDVPMGVDIYRVEERLCRAYTIGALSLVLALKVGPVAAWRLLRRAS